MNVIAKPRPKQGTLWLQMNEFVLIHVCKVTNEYIYNFATLVAHVYNA